MTRKKPSASEIPALEVIEEATRLLRRLPAAAWLVYAVGSIGFVVVLLHFWADMSRAADAGARLVPAALRLALAYGLMKYCHALFGHCLVDRLQGGDGKPPRLEARQHWRLFASQFAIHATMPWFMLLSLLAMLPFAWTYAGYHNASLLAVSGVRRQEGTGALVSTSLRAAHHAVGQNHWLVSALSVIACLLWLNVLALSLSLPFLLKMLTGAENPFTLNAFAMFNTTVMVAVLAVTWLMASPVARACYAIRCFLFVSRENGDDLRAALRSLPTVAALVAALLCGLATPAHADSVAPKNPATATIGYDRSKTVPVLSHPKDLDQELDRVLSQPDFQWRMPKQSIPEEQKSWLQRMIEDLFKWIGKGVEYLIEKLLDFLHWLFGRDWDVDNEKPDSSDGGGSQLAMRILSGVVILAALALLVMLARWYFQNRAAPKPAAAPVNPVIDLADESVTASDLPEDEWLRLAREKWLAGDHRLALRALFLGSLARLGECGLLAIAAGKTNGMYLREVARKPQAADPLRSAFGQNVGDFERVWYGQHPITGDLFDRFSHNHETIRAHANPS